MDHINIFNAISRIVVFKIIQNSAFNPLFLILTDKRFSSCFYHLCMELYIEDLTRVVISYEIY